MSRNVGDGGHEIDKVHSNDAVGDGPPVSRLEALDPVAGEVGLTSSKIVPHATEGHQLVRPGSLRPGLVAVKEGVCIGGAAVLAFFVGGVSGVGRSGLFIVILAGVSLSIREAIVGGVL